MPSSGDAVSSKTETAACSCVMTNEKKKDAWDTVDGVESVTLKGVIGFLFKFRIGVTMWLVVSLEFGLKIELEQMGVECC